MYYRELIGCFVWLGVSIYICCASLELGFGAVATPGAGFFPFCGGVLIGVFTLLHLFITVMKRETAREDNPSEAGEWKKTTLVIISLFLYPLFMNKLGYIVTTFLLMAFLFLILGEARRFWLKGAGALFVTLFTFFVFHGLLNVRLPLGIFGF